MMGLNLNLKSDNTPRSWAAKRTRGWLGVLALSILSPIGLHAAPDVGGTVYREYKVDGSIDPATDTRFGDTAMAGVSVVVYDENGSVVGSDTSAGDGSWSVDVGSASGSQVLIEFGLPDGYVSGPVSSDNASAVVVANKGTNDINFTVARPSDHSEDNPLLAASCFVTSQNPTDVTLVAVRYNDTKDYGTTLTGGPMDQNEFPQKHYATDRSLYPGTQKTVLSDLGTSKNINGIAWNRRNLMVYGGVYHKWRIDVNVGHMGKIFGTDMSGSSPMTSEWLDLNTYFGVGATGSYTGSNTLQDKANVGYIGFTDLDISDDARTLYAFNAKTFEIYAIPVAEDGSAAVASAADIEVFQMPRPATGTHTKDGVALPLSAAGGLAFHDGRVYATATVTGPTYADMKGVLYSFDATADPASVVVKKELELDYSTWVGRNIPISGGLFGFGGVTQNAPWRVNHPVNEFSPWFFDIAFDEDASGEVRMTLGTRNRSHEVIDPDELYIDPTRGGYAHRVFWNGSAWELETNGSAGSLVTGLDQAGDIYQRSQPNTRFYMNEGLEGPMMHGTFAVVPGFKEIAGMATDNMFGDWDSGVSFHDLSNGLRTRDNNIIYGVDQGYAKGISWGDIEALSEAPPLEVGNFVWVDDGDGLQEAGEDAVVGATVNIYLDANGNGRLDAAESVSPVASTTTDSAGHYLFDLDDGLEYYTDYIITLNNDTDYTGGMLTGFLPTSANAVASDNLDSDAIDPGSGYPEISVRVGNFGETNHSYDFGFIRTVSVGNLVWVDLDGDGVVDGGEPGLPGATVSLCLGDGTTPASDTSGQLIPSQTTGVDGSYLFSGLPDGTYVVKVTAPAGFTATIAAGDADPDTNSSDTDSNGVGGGSTVSSPSFSLVQDGEPTSEDADSYTDLTVDFGFTPNAVMVGSFVWIDSNGDGLQVGESGLAGATVELLLSSGLPALDTSGNSVPSQITGADGAYLFTGLPDEEYVVRVTPPVNYAPTVSGGDPDVVTSDSDSNGEQQPSGKIESQPVSLAAGTEVGGASNNYDPSVDFGFVLQLFDVACASSANGGPANPGDTVTYTIDITNTSGAELTGVDVLNALPVGTSYVADSVTVTGASGGGPSGPTVQTFDFESGAQGFTSNAVWAVGDPNNYTPNNGADSYGNGGPTDANGGTNAWGTNLTGPYPNSSVGACLTSPVFDFSTETTVELAYHEWLEIENGTYDGVRLQYNIGAGWVTVFDTINAATREDNTWSQYVHDASAYAGGQSSVQWRWCLDTDIEWQWAGWYVDDVVVTSSSGGPITQNVCDDFSPANYSGNDGTVNWTTNWTEVGDDGSTATGRFRLESGQLRLESGIGVGASAGASIRRGVDLSDATSATLNYDASLLGGSGAYSARVQIASSVAGPWTTLQIHSSANGGNFGALSSSIPAGFLGAEAHIRVFYEATYLSAFFDNFKLTYQEAAAPAGPTTGAPPNLVTGATIADGATMTVTFQATINSPDPGVSEIVSTTSIDSDQTSASFTCSLSDLVNQPGVLRDYADAPDTGVGTATGNYQTLAIDGGPSHIIDADIKLGALTDDEDGSLQDGTATADDADGSADEDGVSPSQLLGLQKTLPAEIVVTVTNQTGSHAVLYGWIDFDGNGVFDSSERALATVPTGASGSSVTLDFGNVPPTAVASTYARFRFSTDPSSSEPTGAADDGEVEDYQVSILEAPLYDFGDLPDLVSGTASGDYNTRVADSGAGHIIVPGLLMGADVDDELNGASTMGADGDDGARRDDEDGVVVSDLTVLEGFDAEVRVSATNTTGAAATIYGFMDWNGDGLFDGPNEMASVSVPNNSVSSEFTVSFGAVPVGSVANPYVRFRLSTDPGASSASGIASDGEVEDYVAAVIVPDFDLGDADTPYATTLADDGPRHVLGSALVIGSVVDADTDGTPSSNADGDDSLSDDEDGIADGLTLKEGGSGLVSVLVENPLARDATLSGWIDFNDDGTLDNGTERASVLVPQGTVGLVDLDFGTIAGGTAGSHLLRLRLSTDPSAAQPSGAAGDGEIEDHLIDIVASMLDFTDAPDSGSGTGVDDYETLLANNGPRHVLANGLLIGSEVDAETDGAPNSDASGDDVAGSPDDEDGLTATLVEEGGAVLAVAVSNPLATEATLYGWIDFNGNGQFEAGESASAVVGGGTAGQVVLDFGVVPAGAVSNTFVRLRVSTDAAASSPLGLATDGEVEDHPVSISPPQYDYADAPDAGAGTGGNNYNTLDSDNGPYHVLANGLVIGSLVDADSDGQPDLTASGDDLAGSPNDEDGLSSVPQFNEGLAAVISVPVNNPLAIDATLNGWIDFNGDGVFDNATEKVSATVPAGSSEAVVLDFGPVPNGAVGATFVRLRLSTDSAAGDATGGAFDGEVEDHPVTIVVPQYDWADAPSADGYETLAADNGPRHLLGASLYLGALVDDESDGQPDSTATGDDLAGVSDDEDGITGTLLLREGTLATIAVPAVNATGTDATLFTFIDFNQDGDFDLTERYRTAVPDGTNGIVNVSLGEVPRGTAGNTFLRFRLSTDQGIAGVGGAEGAASDGEVEDHPVTIEVPQLDFGDADNSYGTTAASNGPSHILMGNGLVIGNSVDDESDGQPSSSADGDDASDDEDGLGAVTLVVGGSGLLPVTVQNPTPSLSTLYGWIDFNGNGTFDAEEGASVLVPAGTSGPVVLDFGTVPAGFTGTTTVRLRLTSDPMAASPNGPALGGEVEDHQANMVNPSYDWGDAPDVAAGTTTGNYNTQDSDNGPNHIIVAGLQIGDTVDNESDGQQSAGADGDGADEDGVNVADLTMNESSAADVRVEVTNTTGAAATLSGWIDFNGDGLFDNATERVQVSVPDGSNDVEVTLSFGSVPQGSAAATFARFRLSTDEAASDATGVASDGEVEDYPVVITSNTVVDYGDAPDTGAGTGAGNYQTLDADSGPSHTLGSPVYLGNLVDAESDGAPNTAADGDDSAGDSDEDGVDLTDLVLTHGDTALVDVVATNQTGSNATLYAWIDLDGSGSFDAGELQTATVDANTISGGYQLDFGTVGTGFTGTTYARFRLSTDGAAASPTGAASDGEIEDHLVTISAPPEYDFGDAPEGDGYATTLGSGGAQHLLGSALEIGVLVDADDGTLEGTGAIADDANGSDDEDGIVTPSQLALLDGQANVPVEVTVNNQSGSQAILFGWIDFNGDGTFDNATERASVTVAAGLTGNVTLNFPSVPATASADTSGESYLRLRLSTDTGSASSATGLAADGEVEDHEVTFTEPSAIAGTIYEDTDNDGDGDVVIEVVTVELYLDSDGNGTPDGNAIDTVETTDGTYLFDGLPPGDYVVVEIQPDDYLTVTDEDSVADAVDDDQSNVSPSDNQIPVTVLAGETDTGNDFVEEAAKSDTFAGYQSDFASELAGETGLADNPDGDLFSNALEYAFCLNPGSGVSSGKEFCLTKADDGTISAQFFRRRGGLSDVTYTLEGVDNLALPIVWTTLASITPTVNTTDPDVPADAEKVIYTNIQNATELTDATAMGVVRLKVEVDADESGTITADEIHYSQLFGWQCLGYNDYQCATFSTPFTSKPKLSGTFPAMGTLSTATDLDGNVTFDVSDSAVGADLSALVGNNGASYLQITSGPLEGERFDILSGGVDELTLVNDPDIFSEADVETFNTSSGVPSDGDLLGASYQVICYATVDDLFDPETTYAGEEDTDPNDATRLLFYNNRKDNPGFEVLMLNGTNTTDSKWVFTNDLVGLNDQGGLRIDPSMGNWIHPKSSGDSENPTASAPVTQFAFGMVADHDQAVALNEGYNLTGAMWPVDQSPAGTNGRALNDANGFDGGIDPDEATELLFWIGDCFIDENMGSYEEGYYNYMLLDGGGMQNWIDINDLVLANQDSLLVMESHRAVLLKLLTGDEKEPHIYPQPSF